jgi:hypothetical protein
MRAEKNKIAPSEAPSLPTSRKFAPPAAIDEEIAEIAETAVAAEEITIDEEIAAIRPSEAQAFLRLPTSRKLAQPAVIDEEITEIAETAETVEEITKGKEIADSKINFASTQTKKEIEIY